MVSGVVHRNALAIGSRINEYVIEGILGEPGGFGIAYLARDVNLDQQVAIKEYLPNDLAMREGTTVYPKSAHDEEDYQWGLERFLDEAKTLAKFPHPNIVQVLRYFEANSTGYMVMRYEDGLPLNEILKKNHLTEEELTQNILFPLLDGLEKVHAGGFLHRDIKPGNIYMRRSDETPVLLDFGAARNALGSKSKSLTSIVTPGYAPFEQYYGDGNQGPWSDIYALGAVAYRIVTGEQPDEAPKRMKNDPLIPAVEVAKGKYSEHLLKAIDHALEMDEEDRPQSCEEWKQELDGNKNDSPSLESKKGFVMKSLRILSDRVLLIFCAVGVILAVAMIFATMHSKSNNLVKANAAQRQVENKHAASKKAKEDAKKSLKQQRLAQEKARKEDAAKKSAAEKEKQRLAKAHKDEVAKAKREADKKRRLVASIPKRSMVSAGQIAFSPDGSKVLYASGSVIKLIDTNTRKLLRSFKGHKKAVHLMAFSPDGKRILSGSYDGTVKLWSLKGQLIRDIVKYSDVVSSIAFSPDGSKIISSGMHERSFRLLDLDRNQVKIYKESSFNDEWMTGNPAHSIVFSPDGRKILSGIQDKKPFSLKLWSVKGAFLRNLRFKDFSKFEKQGCMAGKKGGIDSDGIIVHSISLSFDGSKALVTTGYANEGRCQDTGQPNVFENIVHQFDVSSGRELFPFEGHTDESFYACFSPDGSKVASGGADGTIMIWDAKSGNLLESLGKYKGSILFTAFSPDGSKLAFFTDAYGKSSIRILDLHTDKVRELING